MIIGILLLCTLVESILLYAVRKSKPLILSILILLGFLMIFLKFLPPFFIPEPREDGINCGMPALGIYFAFWGYGIISTVCVAVIFFFTKTRK